MKITIPIAPGKRKLREFDASARIIDNPATAVCDFAMISPAPADLSTGAPVMRSVDLSRRQMMQLAGAMCLAWPTAISRTVTAQAPATSGNRPAPSLDPLNRFPRMVQEYFVDRVRNIQSESNARFAQLKTKADAEAYVQEVQRKIAESFGPFPEKTPLNPRVTKVLERDGYRIENVIFESRPNFLVTANLYVPAGRSEPMPGVIGTCGHSHNGKAAEPYQSFAQGLARQGYVCLIYDPIGQGERAQYGHISDPKIGKGVAEHLYGGNQQFLVGDFFGSWRAWDGIRALDYLLSRPEVDPKQVGVTGNSGGGTLTTWLCGVERRWTMAAPSCFVTSFVRNLENELPADTEQCPPGALALGLDHADFLAAIAPKPLVIVTQEKDYFDGRGSRDAFEKLKHLYRLLGAEENVSLYVGPNGHGYSQDGREAMYRCFNQATHASQATAEPALVIEKEADLYCTPKGEVADLESRTLFSFTADKSRQLAQARTSLTGSALVSKLADVLKLPTREGVPYHRNLRPVSGRQYPLPRANLYAVETEPGVQALVTWINRDNTYASPPKTKAPAILYIAHQSSDAELRNEPLIAELLAAYPDAAFFACDVRGIGESQPDTCGTDQFLKPYGSDYFYAIHSIMLDAPYLGQKTHDVLRVIDWVKSFGHESIHLVGLEWGALPATFAAVISPAVTKVTLKRGLTSYQAIAESEQYTWPLSAFVPSILKTVDLPDCYRALESKSLKQIEPRGA